MTKTKHFETLDGLRGVAAATVLVGHASNIFLHTSWVPRKLLAVQFFFMLSGFVIAHAYEHKLRAGMAWRGFMLRRVIRLYPMITLGAVFGMTSYISGNGYHHLGGDILRIMCAILNLPCVILRGGEDRYFLFNLPAWSLFFEMVSYMIYSAILYRLPNPVLLILAAALAPCSIYAAITFTDHVPFLWHFADSLMAYSIGVLLYRWRPGHQSVGPWTNTAVLGALIVALAISPPTLGWWPDLVATFIAFPMLILAGSSEAPTLRERPITHFLGQISYPLYIIHWPVLLFILAMMNYFSQQLQMIIAISTAPFIAWLSLKIYDDPARRWLIAWSQRK